MPSRNHNMSKICVVSTTPLTVHFFLRKHLEGLARFSNVQLALNPNNDSYTPVLNLPVQLKPLSIMRAISPLADILTIFELVMLFLRERPDLVWAVTPKGGLLGMLAALLVGVKHRVFIFQGEVWASKKGPMRWLLKLTDKICAFCANEVLAVSFSEKNFLADEGVVEKDRIKVLGAGSICGVDPKRYLPSAETRSAVRTELDIPEQAIVALFVGRITADKGVLVLAESFRQLAESCSDAWLLIVGPDEQEITDKIVLTLGAAANRCRVVPFTSEPERYMAAADYLCLPSFREGFGMVILEAAATGMPSIGTNIPGIIDAIQDGKTGLLVTTNCANSLYDAMLCFSSDAHLRQQMGQAARQNVLDNFNSSDVVKRYLDLFEEMVS